MYLIDNCKWGFEFQCPKDWYRLKRTDDPAVRFCDTCLKSVHLAEDEEQLHELAKQGRCVAVDKQECMELGLVALEDLNHTEDQD